MKVVMRDDQYVITNGHVSLYNVEEELYLFEVNLELAPRENPDVNQVAVFGTLIVDRETLIQEENLNGKFAEMPNGVKNWIRHEMRRQIDDHIREMHKK